MQEVCMHGAEGSEGAVALLGVGVICMVARC
jgi:hypothetical protein